MHHICAVDRIIAQDDGIIGQMELAIARATLAADPRLADEIKQAGHRLDMLRSIRIRIIYSQHQVEASLFMERKGADKIRQGLFSAAVDALAQDFLAKVIHFLKRSARTHGCTEILQPARPDIGRLLLLLARTRQRAGARIRIRQRVVHLLQKAGRGT